MLTIIGCDNSPQQNVQIQSSTIKTITSFQTTPITIQVPSPILTSTTTDEAPEFTADIITLNDPYYSNGILFYNGTDHFQQLSCIIRQHDTDGSFISDENVNSGFIAPHSHLVTVLSDHILHSPTIVDLQPAQMPTWQFATLVIKDIDIETIADWSGSQRDSYGRPIGQTTFLVGTLLNPSGLPFSWDAITLQILIPTPNGTLTLLQIGSVYSNPIKGTAAPIPPQGESVKIYIPLTQSVTIKDSANAIIDGEINIYGYYH
jgi:hypothetical protein